MSRTRHFVLSLFVALPFGVASVRADLEADIAAQVKAARAILDPWHAANPQASERVLHLVYWTPSDRDPAGDWQPRLMRIMEDIRDFYAKEMERLGFGPRTIQLDYDADKKVVLHLVKGAGPFADYGMDSGQVIRKECVPVLREAGVDADRETIVIFCHMANWDAEQKRFTHNSPYYAGGSARGGTAWQLDSPELDTTNLPLKEPIISDGQYGRISLGRHNSIFIGGIAHELGHALGLPHNRERPDEAAAFGTALMGSGNRSYGDERRGEGKGSFLTLGHALRLASHPQFSGSVKGLNLPTRADFSDFAIEGGENSFVFSGRVTSPLPVYAVVGYLDPDGGSDYDAPTVTAVPDAEGRFTLEGTALTNGKKAELRVVACHVNGTTSQIGFRYEVDQSGKPDVEGMRMKFLLSPLVAALAKNDNAAVEAAMKALEDAQNNAFPLAVAKRLVAGGSGDRPPPSPSAMNGSDGIFLADMTPSEAKVGWNRPFYDRMPEASALMEAGGRIFESGIYAHAPARHVYALGGKWKRLAGHCGLGDGAYGSVVFVVRADGAEKWRSPVCKPGDLHAYTVNLEGAKELELLVEDAGDGNRSDWGLWLSPKLGR
jgi:hypothetical protein